jgi:hypothetical protein
MAVLRSPDGLQRPAPASSRLRARHGVRRPDWDSHGSALAPGGVLPGRVPARRIDFRMARHRPWRCFLFGGEACRSRLVALRGSDPARSLPGRRREDRHASDGPGDGASSPSARRALPQVRARLRTRAPRNMGRLVQSQGGVPSGRPLPAKASGLPGQGPTGKFRFLAAARSRASPHRGSRAIVRPEGPVPPGLAPEELPLLPAAETASQRTRRMGRRARNRSRNVSDFTIHASSCSLPSFPSEANSSARPSCGRAALLFRIASLAPASGLGAARLGSPPPLKAAGPAPSPRGDRAGAGRDQPSRDSTVFGIWLACASIAVAD